ncbi:MAG: hypothetical protein ABW148_18705 [Sedimenticola sp.]
MNPFNKGDVGVNLDGVHGRIHQGQFFLASEFNTISGGSTFNYLISTNNSSAHFSFDITTNSDVTIIFRKQVVVSAIGTPLDGLSVNDFSTIEPQTVITTDATLSDVGSEWECILLLAGPGNSRNTQIGASRVEEFVLKTNDFYAISIENLSAQTIDICTRIGWYEPSV